MSNTAKLFWCNLHRIRNEKGLTASALELNLGIPTGRFKQMQRRGTLPQGKVIDRIVDYLKIEHIELFENWDYIEVEQ